MNKTIDPLIPLQDIIGEELYEEVMKSSNNKE